MDAEPTPRDGDDEGRVEQVALASTSSTVVQAGRDATVTVHHVHARSPLDEAAARLASASRSQWVREAESWRAYDPRPLRVRWRPSDLGDQHVPAAGKGELDDLVEVHRTAPGGRVLVLGGPGSGKTVLAVHFLLTTAATRAEPGGRVPVLFGLGSWNPEVPLRDWLADRLARDYPIGVPLAADLVADERVLPILDGFDEIADGLHARALAELNATTMPLVLTSRPDEYRTAVEATARRLTRAVAVELEDLDPADRADYLTRGTHRTTVVDGRAVPLWDPVLERIDQDGPLLQALATPLMVGLARTVYGETPDADPTELLDADRFPTAHHVEQHLLASWVPAVHRPSRGAGWETEQVEHWLAFLARNLRRTGTPDLAWWRLDTAVPRLPRALLTGVTTGAVAAAWAWLVLGSPVATLVGLPVAAVVALAVSTGPRWLRALGAFLVGLGFGAPAAFLPHADSAVRTLATGLVFLGLHRLAGPSDPVPSSFRFRGRPRPGEVWRKARFVVAGALLGELMALSLFVVRPGDLRDRPIDLTSTRFVLVSVELVALFVFLALLYGIASDFSVRLHRKRFVIVTVVAIVLFSAVAMLFGSGRVPLDRFPGLVLLGLWASVTPSVGTGFIAGTRKQFADFTLAGYVVTSGLTGTFGGAAFGAVLGSSVGERLPTLVAIPVFTLVGAVLGVLVGVVAAIGARAVRVITDFETTIDLRSATSPSSSLAMDRTNAIVQGTAFASALGALTWTAHITTVEMAVVMGGIAGVVLLSGKAWGRWLVIARFWLPLTGKLPWRLPRFLAEARRLGVLRQAGAVHQFRHARLQDHYG